MSDRLMYNLVGAVAGLLAFFLIAGVGLIILYAGQNTASVAVTTLTTSQKGNVTAFFGSLIGSYTLLPIVGLAMILSLIIGAFMLFVHPTEAAA